MLGKVVWCGEDLDEEIFCLNDDSSGLDRVLVESWIKGWVGGRVGG